MTEQAEAKTIGYTPFHYCSDRPLFRVNGGVPLKMKRCNKRQIFCISPTTLQRTPLSKGKRTAMPGPLII